MSYFTERFNGILNENNSSDNKEFIFYHLLPKGSNISKGILSLEYFYDHDTDKFVENSYKYRERLCNGWGIYPGKDPKSLTPDEVHDGINKFRKSKDGCNQIYLFKFPPYKELGKQMAEILDSKDIYAIDVNKLLKDGIITDIDYGYMDSFTGNDKLGASYYRDISFDDYFKNYTEDDPNRLLFSYMNHISVIPKNGYIPKRYIKKLKRNDLKYIRSVV